MAGRAGDFVFSESADPEMDRQQRDQPPPHVHAGREEEQPGQADRAEDGELQGHQPEEPAAGARQAGFDGERRVHAGAEQGPT